MPVYHRPKRLGPMLTLMLAALQLATVNTQSGYLSGIGYREQELQQEKGTKFQSSVPTGVSYASFGGGTNIFIAGSGLADPAQKNIIILNSVELSRDFILPALTEDDAFQSNVMLGEIAYRLPSPDVILGVPKAVLGQYQTLTFYLRVKSMAEEFSEDGETLSCKSLSLCLIKFTRAHSPVLYGLSPPIVYAGSENSILFNPKAVLTLIQDIRADDTAFINAKVGGSLIDFEGFVDETTTYGDWRRNNLRGIVGQLANSKNEKLSMMWEVGRANPAENEIQTCSFDNKVCYETKVVPVITQLSVNSGYVTGMNNLTVTGFGFDSANIKATVAGVECKVTNYSKTSFNCEVQKASAVSPKNVPQTGSNGLRQKVTNSTLGGTTGNSFVRINTLDDATKGWQLFDQLSTTFETTENYGHFYGKHYVGWFVPPETTKYRFYMACDDYCQLYLGSTPDTETTPELLLDVTNPSNFRNYWKTSDGSTRISKWVSLEKGKNYFIEGKFVEVQGSDYFSVGVEIEQTSNTDHYHQIKQVKKIGINVKKDFDTTKITITNPDGKNFIAAIQNPTTLVVWKSADISTKATAAQMQSALSGFWSSLGCGITVTLELFDSAGAIVAVDDTTVMKRVYTIKTNKLFAKPTHTVATLTKTTTTSTLKIEGPSIAGLSSQPLGGNYKIKCKGPDGVDRLTDNISYNQPWSWVSELIQRACGHLLDKIYVFEAFDEPYKENGISLLVYHAGFKGDPGTLEMISSDTSPLTGTDITFYSQIVQPHGTNLFYDVIPFEFLKTYETLPQVKVEVDGTPAVCHNLNCDYSFIEATGEITGFTFTESTKQLVVTGTGLPATIGDYQYVDYALTRCKITATTVTASGFTCVLEADPVCGKWTPKVVTQKGLIPSSATLAQQTITCTITLPTDSASSYNPLGADIIKLTGKNLPKDLKTSTVEIRMKSTNTAHCVPQQSQSHHIKCETQAFVVTSDGGQNVGVDITINGVAVDTSALTFPIRPSFETGISVVPNSVSPVLKQKITITLGSSFPGTLVAADFTVKLTSQSLKDTTITGPVVKNLNVVAVDQTAKTLTIMFGGAYSGIYHIGLRHAVQGMLKSDLVLTVGSTVTNVTPKLGGIYGGTILTITGTNFGTEKTDNPVSIVYTSGVQATTCFVLTTSATQITCRVDDSITKAEGDRGEVIVFLKTSEEAVCAPSVCKDFTFTSTVPEVTGVTPVFDSTNKWKLEILGSGFGTSPTGISLKASTTSMTLESVTDGKLTFAVENLLVDLKGTMTLAFPIGSAKGNSIVKTGVSLIPKFVGVSPSAGSSGGQTIKIDAPGAGPWMTDVTIVDNAGATMCASVKIPVYGTVLCETLAKAFNSQSLKLKKGTTSITCVQTDGVPCAYSQAATNQPTFTAVTKSDKQIIFTGTNLPTSGNVASAFYNGVEANVVTIDSATQVTAEWTLGVPFSGASAIAPVLKFTDNTSKITVVAIEQVSTTSKLANAYAAASSSAGLSCSFAGGCKLGVTSTGLASNLKFDSTKNYISVCGKVCQFSESDSTFQEAKCVLPAISTGYSVSTKKIEKPSVIKPFKVSGSGTAGMQKLAFDGSVVTQNTDSTASCQITMEFEPGFSATLNSMKYFLDSKIDKQAVYANLLQFKGSNDGTTFTTIFTADQAVHTGWNYVTFDQSALPKYKVYRFTNSVLKGCDLNEIELQGTVAIDDTQTSYQCVPKVFLNGTETSTALTEKVTFSGDKTAVLDKIEPRWGAVEGGETLTLTGSGFTTVLADISIVLDQVKCEVLTATETKITCRSGPRTGIRKSTLEMSIVGFGKVSTQGVLFTYVNKWSSMVTWGGEFPPIEGESVFVPKGLNLLVDIDQSPILKAVIVQGALIFPSNPDPNHHRTFDARYIYLDMARMEVGTEENPYTSKLTITMHGNITDPYLPIYGNKCIAVRHSQLDMHGVKRTPTWTVMKQTELPGATTITLNEAVDWKAGEMIAIAPTSFNVDEAEVRKIVSVDNTNALNPILTLDKPLEFKHYADSQTYGSQTIEMRAEVGLLSRNIVFRGDPETSAKNQYGGIIFMHSIGDDSLSAKLEYVELTDVGQAFKIGRYAVHFHMIGNVHNSYVRGNSVHTSYNRAFTFHGTSSLRLQKNVIYNAMGHNVFIEDAVERYNQIEYNLAMKTKRSWSLLNTDQSPASFWITNPNNDFVGNHAAGSDRYGYWYDLQIHAIGPSASDDVCPEFEYVGRFQDNHAHSNGRYGLRIFHNMVPRMYPCKPIIYDASRPSDPFWRNPIQTARFERLTSWKNNRNGAIAGQVGDVRFIDFKVADNILAGIEFERTDTTADGRAGVYNSLIIGKTANTEDLLNVSSPRGIISPRSENFTIDAARFYNFDWNSAAALGDCSHCFHPAATDAGARQVTVSNLYFDSTVSKRIRYQFPYLGIYKDLTGELTMKGPNTWAMGYLRSNVWPGECEVNLPVYDGTVCESSVQVRRVAIYNYQPISELRTSSMYLLQYDDDLIASKTNVTQYILDRSNYGVVNFKEKRDPMNAHTFPIVTGHKYKFHYRNTGVDYDQLSIELSEKWQETDKPIYLFNNFTDVRAKISLKVGGNEIANGTLSNFDIKTAPYTTGMNMLYNWTDTKKEFHFVLTGKNLTSYPKQNRIIDLLTYRCIGSCLTTVAEAPMENRTRYWSVLADWGTNGKIPVEGDTVIIQSGWTMVYDLAGDSPIFKLIQVNGKLQFDDKEDRHLRVKHLFIRAGELAIGNATTPFAKNAKITLYGERNAATMVYDNAIEAGNKLIANIGKISFYGKPRKQALTRLFAPATVGATSITIDKDLDIVAGDRIALAPTSFYYTQGEDVIVTSYDPLTGVTKFNTSLKFYHWGAAESTVLTYGVDIRAEVQILTRNVVVRGENFEGWGGQIVTSDALDADLTIRMGSLVMHNVELYNMSQTNTMNAALRFEGNQGSWSHVKGCSIHNGLSLGIGIVNSANLKIEGTMMFKQRVFGIRMTTGKNITIDGNVLSTITEREVEAVLPIIEPRAGISACADGEGLVCSNLKIINNIVAGAPYGGFVVPGHDCGDNTQEIFKNNVAHSVDGTHGGTGAIIFPDKVNKPGHLQCYEGSYFTAYKCTEMGAFAFMKSYNIKFHHMTMMDNAKGFGMIIEMPDANGQEYKDLIMALDDNNFFGETPIPDCSASDKGCNFINKFQVFNPTAARKGKDAHIKGVPAFPPHKIKAHSSWGPKVSMNRNSFSQFKHKTRQGMDNSIFSIMEHQPDYTPRIDLVDSKFTDIEQGAFAKLTPPPEKWANMDDCGNFPCTAPLNVLFNFKNSQWSGVKPSWATSDFQIIANNTGFSPYVQGCSPEPLGNHYVCTKSSLSILQFESLDDDKMDRSIQPVYFDLQGTSMHNKLNIEMDHMWDGFYTGQVRLARIPAIVDAFPDSTYDITYTGTPPKSQRFMLRHDGSTKTGMLIRIAYPDSMAYSVSLNDKTIEYNKWDDNIKYYAPITRSFCGENRYIGMKNILEFYITGGCELKVFQRNAVQTKVRMEWTIEDFYAKGGTTKLVDRISGALGIHASEIKIVSVYEGSLVVDYQIVSSTNDAARLATVQAAQTQMMATNTLNLGAPILDFTQNAAPVVKDGVVTASGYTPIVITKTATNQAVGGVNSILNSVASNSPVTNKVLTGTLQKFQETQISISNWNPDIKIIEQTEVNTQKTDPIDQTVTATPSEDDLIEQVNQRNTIILAVGIVLAIILLLIVARCFYQVHSNKKILNHNLMVSKKNFQEEEDRSNVQMKNLSALAHPKSLAEIINQTAEKVNQYEEQYDPNKDFAIFGLGDNAKGGMVTLQDKINQATDVKDWTSSNKMSSFSNPASDDSNVRLDDE